MDECIFCSIAAGKTPAVVVYRDDDVLAFMDKNPINPGHVLIVPNVHKEHLQNLNEELYLKVMLVARKIAKAANEVFSPKKMGFAVAGFDVPHAHLHVIPLEDYHDLTSRHYMEGGKYHRAGEGSSEKVSQEVLQSQADQIVDRLNSRRGVD